MKIIKKAPVFNYKEFENCLLEMNNRESDVANLMVPIDLAKVLKFILEDSFSVKELLDQNFQPESIVAAVDYMWTNIVGNHTILHKITRNDAVDFVEEKQVAFEILEFYIHQSCSVIYSIIDGRLKK
ncbi:MULTISPECIES: hypothetical protein [Bacillus cereus group]|uniref:hypothetical protein n=1 Tax=Bacillus cereus group TaxID=86661 RepID=UPI00210717EF|nr:MULTISPECIES: hypothetical protein [Bacillus cereus group]MCU5003782.1 hypothetical protein [Bacillus tropicus]